VTLLVQYLFCGSKVSGIHKLYEDITTKVYKYLATADVETGRDKKFQENPVFSG
jgi:hypothetical protein